MKVAIPDVAYVRPLIARAADVCAAHGWDLQVVPEERAGTSLPGASPSVPSARRRH